MPDLGTLVLVLIIVGIVGDELTKRAARRAAVVDVVAATPASALPVEARAYLTTLDAHLHLPEEVRREIELELRDHFEDSVAGLEAEGLDRERATREAMARLGQPQELARQLRVAHQSNRRLLAGAAGGVFSSAAGIIYGYIVGAALVMGLVLVAAVVASLTIGRYLPPLSGPEVAVGTIFGALIAYVAAFLAARRAVSASALISHRPARQLAPWWALAGAVVTAWLVLFVVRSQQSWPAVVAELAIPVAFAAGAFFRMGTRPRIPSRVAALCLVIVVLLPILLLGAAEGHGSTTLEPTPAEPPLSAMHLDRIAPLLTDSTVGIDGPMTWYPGKPDVDFRVIDPSALAGWHDLRIEAWRAAGVPGFGDPFGAVDTRFSSPYAVQPVAATGDTVTVRFDFDHSRTMEWLLVATGTAPDGARYLLTSFPHTIQSQFSGTVWDWLTASE